MNPIQKLIQTKINCLSEMSDGFEAIDHNATKGSLRESLLIEFFKSVLPSRLSISSGIVCDAKGKTSKQTDFIIYDKQILPSILLTEEIAVIPVDAVYLIAEIKTTLQNRDLTQVIEARKAFNSLQLSSVTGCEVKMPSVILTFKNKVSKNSLIEWLKETNDVVSICIIGEYTLSKQATGVVCYEDTSDFPNNWGTLNFCTQLHDFLNVSVQTERPKPNWGAYLQGPEEFAKLNELKLDNKK